MARKDFEEYKKKNEPNRYHGGAGIKPSERVKTASERLVEKARQVEAQKRQREAQAAQVKQYEEKAAEVRRNNLPLYGAVGGLYNKYGLSTGSQIVSGNAKRLEQREMQDQLAHATEMSDTYAQLYGSGKTTPSQKAEALEQKNRFDQEAWAAQQRLDELGYVEPNSVFVPDYTELPMKPSFDVYAKMGAGMETDIRPEEIEGSYTYFDLLSDEEQGVFNYLLATQGEQSAQNYMDFMRNTAQHRYGQRVAQGIEDSDWRTGALIANSLGTGVTNWMEGMMGAYGAATGQEVAENGLNYASPYIKENLGVVGNVAYDLGVAVGNMLPSVMLGGAAGNVSMGLSAGGNAYQQGIREGMSNSEALVYGSLIGASEAYLQRAMGGISRLSGAKASKLDDALRGIENGFLRFISKTGVGMVKEGGEEALQAALEPMFNSLISGGDVDIDWSEVAYDALMGALVGGVFEAPQNLVETVLTEGEGAMFAPASEKPQNFASEGVMPTDNNVPAEAPNAAEIRPDSPGLAQARERLRQSTFAAAKKSFGKEGYAAFEAQAQAMDNPADNFGEMARAYNDGMVNRHAASYGSLSGAQYEAMFEAGKADAEASIASQMDKRNKVFSYKNAGIDMADAVTKEYSATLDARDAKTLNAAAKAFGLKIRFADSVAGGAANAEIRNGVITIEKGNPKPLRSLFGHEVTHRMQELAPQEYARLREAAAATGDWLDARVRKTIANYNSKGRSISREAAMDEAIADYMGEIIENSDELERFVARFSGERTLLQKLRDIIRDIAVALSGSEQAKRMRAVEKRLSEAMEAAAKQAQSNAKATKNAAQESDGEFETMFKLKDKDESNSIKTQIAANQAKLNAMEPVANFTVPTSFGKTMGDARKWVINTLKASGYKVERKDFGTIVFDEKRLNTSLDYINNAAEIGAYAALPRVLKRGIKIGEHNNHKGRDYGTVTFAAPVVMNGKRGNMGVVVKMTSQNYYKMHRILMPDGSVYELNVQKNAESTPTKGAASAGSHASPIDSAVATRVSQDVDIVKVEKAVKEGRSSLKDSDTLVRDIVRIQREGVKNKRSDAEIQADIRAAVQEAYQSMVDTFGAIEPGENAYREVQVPSRTAKTNRVSQTARTVMEAQATPDDFIPLLKENVAKGGFSFMPISNDETLLDAEGWILARGWQTALKDWTAEVRRGMGGARVTAVGALLYNHAVNAGDYNTAMDILADYQLTVRNDARGLQTARILKTLTPESRLYMIQKSIQSMVDDLGLKGKDGEKLELPAELIETYKKAKTNKEIDEAVGDIQQYVADNVKFSLGDSLRDKWTALRYVNMLGNLKTQVRNISGNVGMKVVGSIENAVATFLETAAGKKAAKTRALVVSPEMRKLASADFENIRHEALGEDKYTIGNENRSAFEAGVLERRRVFWFPPLEAYRKATNWAMNNKYFGDEAFSRSGYARALAGYLTANKVSAEQFASAEWQEKHHDFVDKARMFAVKRAQELTFRDHNTFSDWVSKVGRRPDTPAAVRKVSEGVLPFRRTPANVLLRAEEYSPLGIINTAIAAARAAKGKGNVTGTDVINSLSKTLTGTGIFIIGMVLQNLGLLKGNDDEDQRVAQFEELVGHQTYALELKDGTSITLDWLTPSSMPLFMGAQLEALRQDGGFELKDIEAAMLSIADPMLQMSMMQGLNDSLSDLRYAQDANIGQLIASAALGYLTQGLTNSLVGQSERAHNTESTMTYTQDTALPTWLQKEIGAVSRKTPGWDFQQIPYIDAWGRIEDLGSTWERAMNSFLNPAYLSKVDISSMEIELMRLYEKLGEDASAVFPSRAQKYIDNVPINPIDPESETMRKDLTAEEYVKYATEKGQLSYNLLTDMMGNEVYKRLSEIDQVDAIDKAYDYANAIAKTKVSDYKLDGWVAKANKAITETKIKPETYIPIYVAQGNIESLKDKNGKTISNSKSLQVMQLVYSVPGLTDKQRKALFEAFDVSESIRHYNRTLVEQKLREMQRKAR